MENLSKKIRELRKEQGLTQKELAEKLLTAQPTVAYWEQNKRYPDLFSLRKICNFFDVSADYLLGRVEEY